MIGPGTDPLVSVAVSTHNRAKSLALLLAALEQQTLGVERFEVVVTDDASSDDTPQTLASFAEHSSLRLSVVRFDTNRGQAIGRNAAWERGRAPVVAFTDDDCLPTPTWLEEGLRSLDEPCVLVGATEPEPSQRHLLNPIARTMHVIRPTFAPTCNVFYLRRDLEEVGGFDEGFGLYIGEDTDLAWRVHRQIGRPLRFGATALVHHEVRQLDLRSAIRSTKRWGGVGIVVKRHPELANEAWPRRFLRATHPRALVAALGVILTPAFPLAVALTLPWLRYRIFTGKVSARWLRDARYIPAAFIVDLCEIYALAKGSVRNRVWIL